MYRAATVAAAVYNANPFREKGSDPVDPVDFVPAYRRRREEARRPQTLDEQIAVLTAVMGCGPGKPN